MKQRCGSCRFGFYVEGTEKQGRCGIWGVCRRHAPRPLAGGVGTGHSDWEWPTVNEDEWCGEWAYPRLSHE